jgi:hypothetical protein
MSPTRAAKKKLDNSYIAIIVAAFGLVGTLITGYFSFRASSRPLEISISTTQTAEARSAEQAQIIYEATLEAKLLPTVFAQVNSTMQAQNTNQNPLTVDTTPLLIFLHSNPEKLLSSDSKISDEERASILSEFFNLLPSSYQGRKAGIVVTIGYSSPILEGQSLARIIDEIIQTGIPSMFSNAVFKDYGFEPPENNQIGIVRLEVYFFH